MGATVGAGAMLFSALKAGRLLSPAGLFLGLPSSFCDGFVIKLPCMHISKFSKEVTEWNL